MKRRSFLVSGVTTITAFLATLTGVRRVFAMRSHTAKIPDSGQDTNYPNAPKIAHCVLCGKTRGQVKKLILGKHGGVCLECIALCNEIIQANSLSEMS